MLRSFLNGTKELLDGMKEGFILKMKIIKYEKNIYKKILYILVAILDVFLLPLNILVISLGMLFSEKFIIMCRNTYTFLEEEFRERE